MCRGEGRGADRPGGGAHEVTICCRPLARDSVGVALRLGVRVQSTLPRSALPGLVRETSTAL